MTRKALVSHPGLWETEEGLSLLGKSGEAWPRGYLCCYWQKGKDWFPRKDSEWKVDSMLLIGTKEAMGSSEEDGYCREVYRRGSRAGSWQREVRQAVPDGEELRTQALTHSFCLIFRLSYIFVPPFKNVTPHLLYKSFLSPMLKVQAWMPAWFVHPHINGWISKLVYDTNFVFTLCLTAPANSHLAFRGHPCVIPFSKKHRIECFMKKWNWMWRFPARLVEKNIGELPVGALSHPPL